MTLGYNERCCPPAGVSTSTVSHVINKDRFVSEAITAKVEAAIKELNYAPSALARSLKLNQTHTIGMLITASTNPFYSELVRGVERSCFERGYSLVLCNTEGDEQRMNRNLETLMQNALMACCYCAPKRISLRVKSCNVIRQCLP